MNKSSCYNLSAFSNDLDSLCVRDNAFFTPALLFLIEKHFHYPDLSITIYTDDYKFCGGFAINDAKPLQDYYIKNRLYDNDKYSQYITRQCLRTSGMRPVMLNSRDSLKNNDYFSSDYYNFLNKFGYCWTASMVFGNYRLNIHKKDADGEFFAFELDFFNDLYSLLTARVQLFDMLRVQQSCINNVSTIVTDLDIGFVIVNSSQRITQYNDLAVEYISRINPSSNFQYAVSSLICDMERDGNISAGEKTAKVYNDLFVSMTRHIENQEFGFTHDHCLITVKRLTNSVSDEKMKMELFSKEYGISQKEFDIIKCLAKGLTYAQTAATLFVSINTVRSHIKNIYAKTGVNNQSSLLALYNKR